TPSFYWNASRSRRNH
ncbi:flagellar hook-associated family protein, partial [Vibrio parahaemolyticus AQ3810]